MRDVPIRRQHCCAFHRMGKRGSAVYDVLVRARSISKALDISAIAIAFWRFCSWETSFRRSLPASKFRQQAFFAQPHQPAHGFTAPRVVCPATASTLTASAWQPRESLAPRLTLSGVVLFGHLQLRKSRIKGTCMLSATVHRKRILWPSFSRSPFRIRRTKRSNRVRPNKLIVIIVTCMAGQGA